MLLQSEQLGAVLADKGVLIDLISRLLNDILSDTRHLQRGSSPFHCKDAPSISVGDYLKRILKFAHCSSAIFIVSLIYIDRLQESLQGFVLNQYCVHRLLITTLMVAAKFGDDFFYKNEYYAKIGGISKLDINAFELELLQTINYHCFVTERELMVYIDRLEAYRDVNREGEPKFQFKGAALGRDHPSWQEAVLCNRDIQQLLNSLNRINKIRKSSYAFEKGQLQSSFLYLLRTYAGFIDKMR